MQTLKKRITRRLRRAFKLTVFNPSLAALVAALYGLRLVLPVKALLLNEFRFGEFIGATDLYLRRLEMGIIDKPKGFVFAIISDPSNQTMVEIYRRKFPIIQSKLLYTIAKQSMMVNSPFVERLPALKNNEFYEFNATAPTVPFTVEEEERGQRLLREAGIPEGAWYICFHARDSAYLRQRIQGRDMSYTDVRNASIENCYDTMQYVADQGGYAVRMGSAIDNPLPDLKTPRIIDYASNYRSDFGDIYLLANCRFLLASGGGITLVCYAYNVPVVNANEHSFATSAPLGEKDLCLPKPIWSNPLGRFLSWPEILSSDACFKVNKEHFDEVGLEMRENSSIDILAVAQEMFSRLNGSFVPDEDDEELLQKFRGLLTPSHVAYKMPGRIGAAYLKANRDLLEWPDTAEIHTSHNSLTPNINKE